MFHVKHMDGRFILWTLVCFAHLHFSLIRKMKMGETINHPLCGCASIVIQKNHLSVYNRVVQAILQKGKVIYGEERKCTRTYKMDVQISYVSNYSTKDKCIVIYGIFKRKKCAYDIRSTRKLKV